MRDDRSGVYRGSSRATHRSDFPPSRYNRGPMKRYLAESIGTFALVFAGTAAIVINELNGGVISHVGVAPHVRSGGHGNDLFGGGTFPGAHLNPAVTLGFWASGRMSRREVAPYVVSQSAGALAASLIVRALFLESQTLGATIPAGRASQSFVLEVPPHIHSDVRDSRRFHRRKREGPIGRSRRRWSRRPRVSLRGTRLGCVDESGALPRTRAGEWTRPSSLDLSHGSGARRSPRGRRLSLCAGLGML